MVLAFYDLRYAILEDNFDNLKKIAFSNAKKPPSTLRMQTRLSKQEILTKKAQVEEEEKGSMLSDEDKLSS
jgi:hypothetical protein